MTNNRVLEAIKRLLAAETYFHWREEVEEHELSIATVMGPPVGQRLGTT